MEKAAFDAIERDVLDGLAASVDRREAHRANIAYADNKNMNYLEKRPAETYAEFQERLKQVSSFTHSVVGVMSRNVWSPAPVREFANATAKSWLPGIYKQCHVDAKLSEAERLALLNGACILEVQATGDPKKPIELYLWGSDEYEVYTDGDPTVPTAIATKSFNERTGKTTYGLWTAEEFRKYETEGDREFLSFGFIPSSRPKLKLVQAVANPYAPRLPFVHHHAKPVVRDYWDGGIGDSLRSTNEVLDELLCNVAQTCQIYGMPFGFSKGVRAEWVPMIRPGGFQSLEAGSVSKVDPEVFLLESELKQIKALWETIKNTGEMKLQELQVPVTAVYKDPKTDLSGIAIVAQEMPMLAHVKHRQAEVEETEQELARAILYVAGVHYGQEILVAASEDPGLTVDFAEPKMPLPTKDRLEQDKIELEMDLTSRTELLMTRRGLTRRQAVELLKRLQEDKEVERAILGEPEPAPAPVAVEEAEPAPAA